MIRASNHDSQVDGNHPTMPHQPLTEEAQTVIAPAFAKMNRRRWLAQSVSSCAVFGTAASTRTARASANDRVRVGIIGAGGRAQSLIKTFSANRDVELVAIAEVDRNRFPAAMLAIDKNHATEPRAESDFRRLIDDRTIDAIVVSTPDHWHAIPTILACQSGKDVYVEKPDAHNIAEGLAMIAAMKKHRRIVQMGSQHRSTERLQSALEFVKSGALGRVLVAKAWENSKQGNIGKPRDSIAPAGVDYDMWLGPAPLRPFNSNRFHGRWRWFYDYGTGDLGNDGVHRLDMSIALLNAACVAQGDAPVTTPTKVSAHGGKWYFDDAQEFPDTMQINYEFHAAGKTKLLTYELRIWTPYRFLGETEGAAVFGDQGYLVVGNEGWAAYDRSNKPFSQGKGDSHEAPHVQDFIDCVRTRNRPACDLELIGHPASFLCHAGNIAARVGRTLTVDPHTESFIGDVEANALRSRSEYRKPWTIPG